LSRPAEAAHELVGVKSATLTTLAGQAKTHLLGDSFLLQVPLLHRNYFGKVAVSLVSSELVALSQRPLDLAGHPNAIRDTVRDDFRTIPAKTRPGPRPRRGRFAGS